MNKDRELKGRKINEASIYAILMAGGRGSRFGGEPKQFRLLGDMPLIFHSLTKLCDYRRFKRIIIPVPEEFVDKMKAILEKYREILGHVDPMSAIDIIDVIPGGSERWESLDLAINHIELTYGIEAGDIAVTHDAARPFITMKMIESSIESAMNLGASTCAVQATDTITSSPGGKEIGIMLDRDEIFNIQTPQTFNISLYQRARSAPKMDDELIRGITDIAGLFRYADLPVAIVPGDRWNIKVTYEEDFRIAEAILGLE